MALKQVRGGLFLFIALVVWLPLLNYWFGFIESGKLNGVAPERKPDELSWTSWWQGKFQEQRNDVLNDSIGFRPDLVRMNNQLDFWLFHKINAANVVAGKDNYLFEANYIDEYNGRGFDSDTALRTTCYKIRRLQDTLEKLGKTMVFVVAPSKAYVMKDKLPQYLLRKEPHTTSYYSFVRLADSIGVHTIDFNKQFVHMQDTVGKRALIPQLGIHWSVYGALLAGDSLLGYLSAAMHKPMPRLKIKAYNYSVTPQSSDGDLGGMVNTIAPLGKEELTYPDYQFSDTAGDQEIIYVGDSFLMLWMYTNVVPISAKHWEYWYYFHTVWPGNWHDRPMEGYDWKKQMLAADAIVMEYTPINLAGIGGRDGFISLAYDHFYPIQSAK